MSDKKVKVALVTCSTRKNSVYCIKTLKELRQHAIDNDYQVIEEYVDEFHFHPRRTALKKCLKHAAQRKFEMVILYNSACIGILEDTSWFYDPIKTYGIKISTLKRFFL